MLIVKTPNMISVKVTYTVKDHFVDQNIKNIHEFLKDFGSMDNDNFKYSIHVLEDRKTFMHLSQYNNQVVQQELLNVSSFLSFQKQRDENLESEPAVELLNLIGASKGL